MISQLVYILWKNVVIKTRFIFYNWWVATCSKMEINWLLVYYYSAPNFPIVLFPLPTSLPHPPGFRHRWWGCRRWFPPLSWLEAGPHPQWCPSWQGLSRPCAAPSRSDRHSWSGCTLGRGGWRKAVKDVSGVFSPIWNVDSTNKLHPSMFCRNVILAIFCRESRNSYTNL